MKLLIAVIAALLILPFGAGATTLDEISAHLSTITTLETKFTQVNADGSTSTGTLYIRRPGKLRMEYDANGDGALLIAGGGSVAIFDGKTGSSPAQYPLSRTPLSFILTRSVDLSRSGHVGGLSQREDSLFLEAKDPKHPELGKAEFGFDKDTLRLFSWTMTNEFGDTTRVYLDPEMKTGHDLSLLLFSIPQEQSRRER